MVILNSNPKSDPENTESTLISFDFSNELENSDSRLNHSIFANNTYNANNNEEDDGGDENDYNSNKNTNLLETQHTYISNDSKSKLKLNLNDSYGSVVDNQINEETLTLVSVDNTSILKEIQGITKSSMPLMVTFLLQRSFSAVSVFFVGHLGKTELGAVTLGSMTANITGISIIIGLATCLDTLCSQAYGSKNYKLVGVYCQRCIALLLTIIIPILLFWIFLSESFLNLILSDKKLSSLSASYLKINSIGMPGFILFECLKRFLQSQGIFHASTYVLIFCSPANILLHCLLIYNKSTSIGYLGAPLAVAINYWLMPLGLILYLVFNNNPINPLKCWNGLNIRQAFKGWSRIITLAINGIIMIVSEFLAFEILTLSSSYLSLSSLAANSVIMSIISITYQLPFSIAIAVSTRLANYVGANLVEKCKNCVKAGIILSLIMGLIDAIVLFSFKENISRFFTNDEEVLNEIYKCITTLTVIQIFDSMNAITSGILRGEGMQEIGSITNLSVHYLIGIPVSFFLGFKMNLRLNGLWIGMMVGLTVVSVIQGYYGIIKPNWDSLIRLARYRTEIERNI
ncbi:MATE family efflux transporter [Ascoidea rubescens DSM 1968]|uniref:MATE efflux family protein n=1 Tax=Ascoidea rubescens DSM 1968 TaxID=1344418 RepID=A0A1D2VH17_9ASCO|nr:MATE efflux family protein [Ascoidea rubescens DSM 1968]ODV60961.1 MATE efflux family protein [Ascoidea rubescens DSM 1968]